MSLPIRTTVEDIDAVCKYLATKPTGATLAEARAVVDKKRLDGRKLTALKFWELIEDTDDNKMKITEQGRRCVRDSGAARSSVLREVIRKIGPYAAVVERAVHGREESFSATDVAANWHEHFRDEVSENDKILNDQAICFFQIAQGADLGVLKIGRKGMPTRFEFDTDAARIFVEGSAVETSENVVSSEQTDVEESTDDESPAEPDADGSKPSEVSDPTADNNRVFITHGKNRKILDQIKQLVAYGKLEPVIAMEHETAAKPVPQKVMDDMRTCKAAVIHVDSERVFMDENGEVVELINENVLIEIGAAMALYRDNFVLLVEEGVDLPSNLQGLYECRYKGDELNMTAVMKLLEAFNEF
ncbi:MAG: hypothetical protein F4W93_12640 [Dehalococcoidia bacterium]|nr:hypothetical protein [Dehalococcoidia bacterium]